MVWILILITGTMFFHKFLLYMNQLKKIVGLLKPNDTLQFIHISEEPSSLGQCKLLLSAYGKYMFDDLG